MGTTGRALIFLLPKEAGFLKYLREAHVTLNQYEFSESKIANVQSQLEHLVSKNYYLNKSAREAFRSYVQAYASHSLKTIFNAKELDLTKVAHSFGLSVAPHVDLNPKATACRLQRRGGGHGMGINKGVNKARIFSAGKRGVFSASNPTGRRAPGDKRQLVRI